MSFERVYRGEDGKPRSTYGLGRDDLLLLAKVADLAFDEVCRLQQADRAKANGHAEATGDKGDPPSEEDGGRTQQPTAASNGVAASTRAKRSR